MSDLECIGVSITSVWCLDLYTLHVKTIHVPFIELSLASNIWRVQIFIVLLGSFAVSVNWSVVFSLVFCSYILMKTLLIKQHTFLLRIGFIKITFWYH